jgi:hypothetical protein
MSQYNPAQTQNTNMEFNNEFANEKKLQQEQKFKMNALKVRRLERLNHTPS